MNPLLAISAIAAGALTVLSPCILPVLPALLCAAAPDGLRHRPAWIVLGLSTSFTLFGAAFAAFGNVLGLSNEALRDAALAVLLLFGLSLLWPRPWEAVAARLAALGQRIPGAGTRPSPAGRAGALLVGASLGLVWAPCAGPILGIIITVAAVQKDFARSLALLGAYSVGAAVPMLLIGYGGNRLYRRFLSPGRWSGFPRRLLGAVTLATVVALALDVDTLILARIPASLFVAGRLEKRLAGVHARGTPPGAGSAPGAGEAAAATSLPVLGTMPGFAGIVSWLNSGPLDASGLRGKVVLVDFWTYSCINCIRTLPYVTGWYEKYRGDGFVVIGVHTPEFGFEKDADNVRRAVARFGIRYPVALDNFYGTWNAYHNAFWPADYLFDAEGRLREVHFGEGDYGKTERAIRSLLAEARLLRGSVAVTAPAGNVDFSRIRSPETYIGYSRARGFSSPEAVGPDRARRYTAPPDLGLNAWALRGEWTVGGERAVLDAPGGGVRFRFEAPRLNLVMGERGPGSDALVLLDGAPLPAALRGADVGPDGRVVVRDSRLYNLVRLAPDDRGSHVFEIDFGSPGVALYAFTFG